MQIYPITSISGFDLHSRILPDLFATLAVPKVEELVAFAYRHNGKEKAEAMHRLAEQANPAFPVTIYYAFKQSESNGDDSRRQYRLGDSSRCGDPRWFRNRRHLAHANREAGTDAGE
jgi:hypothetical protein